MTKRDFVQQYVVRWFDRHCSRDVPIGTLVYEAECLWKRLSHHGYGATQERGPREHLNWYQSLTEQQRAWFDRFWGNFAYKQGRNEAAMRWAQINPDAETAEHIIHAAGLEAEKRKKLPDGQTPIMAQGWLNARRWEDYPVPAAQAETTHRQQDRAERARLAAEIRHLDQMIERHGDGEIAQQLREQADDLRGRLTVLEAEADG